MTGDRMEKEGERVGEPYPQAAQLDLQRRAAFLEAAVRRSERWRRRRAGRARVWRRVARRAGPGGEKEWRSGKLNFWPASRRSPPQ
jgi:hypothetical protein